MAITGTAADQSPEVNQLQDLGDQRGGPTSEISKVLQGRRWPEQTPPFRGFASPPGRF